MLSINAFRRILTIFLLDIRKLIYSDEKIVALSLSLPLDAVALSTYFDVNVVDLDVLNLSRWIERSVWNCA